jgi:hypothetical protein
MLRKIISPLLNTFSIIADKLRLKSSELILKIELSNPQYNALLHIYGPPETVHYMFMTAKIVNKTYVINGTNDEFEELLNVISEEIGEGNCSRTNAKHLFSVCKKVDPSSLNWIGM